MSAVSVVIPTYQRRASVLRALAALAAQTLPPEAFEVVVSVDGSTDGTREAVRGFPAPFRLTVLEGPNRGRAAACNAGLRAARGALAVLLDDDMEPAPGFLDAHRRAHEGRPDLGVMGAAPVRIAPGAPPAARYVGDKFNRHLAALARPGHRLQLRDFYSGNFSVARATLLRAGGFDEAFTRYGNEDLELSLRLTAAGVTLVFDPAALAHQTNDKGFAALAADSESKGRTAVLLATKHPAAFDGLRLGGYREGALPARLLRDALLALQRAWPEFPRWVIRGEAALGRAAPPGAERLYAPMLGYFYWLGVRAALREEREVVRDVPALARLARALRA